MARGQNKSRGASEESPPTSFPQTTPEFSQPSHDFTLQAVMQLQRSFGEMSSKLDDVRDTIKGQGTKLDHVEKVVDRVRTGVVVAGTILTAVAFVFWWAIGDRITVAVHSALNPPAVAVPAPRSESTKQADPTPPQPSHR